MLQITQQQEAKADKDRLVALTLRIDELDLAMVRLRSEVWRGCDNEAIGMRGQVNPIRDQSHESQLDFREPDIGGSRWSKRTAWCKTPGSSSCFSLPPTDRPLSMMAEEAPPFWDDTEEAPPFWDTQLEQTTDYQPQRSDLSSVVTVQPSRECSEFV